MSQAQVVAVLTGAREYVNQGWVQGRSRSLDGKRRCAGQAITDAWTGLVLENSHPTEEEMEAFNEASRLLLEAVPSYVPPNIPYWNDNMVTHKSQVLAVFDRAIVLAKQPVEVKTPVEGPMPFATFMVADLVIPPPAVEAPQSVIQKVKELVGV